MRYFLNKEGKIRISVRIVWGYLWGHYQRIALGRSAEISLLEWGPRCLGTTVWRTPGTIVSIFQLHFTETARNEYCQLPDWKVLRIPFCLQVSTILILVLSCWNLKQKVFFRKRKTPLTKKQVSLMNNFLKRTSTLTKFLQKIFLNTKLIFLSMK